MKILEKKQISNGWVASVDASQSNKNFESRLNLVTDIASLTKGKLKFEGTEEQRLKLYNRLLKESVGNPSTPFEFVPVKYTFSEFRYNLDTLLKIARFSHVQRNGVLLDVHTNLRNAINVFGKDIEMFNSNLTDYKVIIGRVPAKVFPLHLRTHRVFAPIAESSRNKKYLNNLQFFDNGFTDIEIANEQTELIANSLQKKGYKGEVANMFLSDFRLVHFAIGGWVNDPYAFENMFKVRGAGNTMGVTAEFVQAIKELIKI
jgi:hypothetical protein